MPHTALSQRGRRRLRVAAVALLALTLVPIAQVSALARPQAQGSRATTGYDGTFDVLVLGDSFSAGNGAGNYIPGSPDQCYRSLDNYGHRFAEHFATRYEVTKPSVWVEACSGAVAANVTASWSERDLRPQIDAVNSGTDLVLLTLGGNDAKFSAIVTRCLLDLTRYAQGCDRSLDFAERLLNSGQLRRNITEALTAIDSELPEHGSIGLFGYPQLEGDPKFRILDPRERVKRDPKKVKWVEVGKRLRKLQLAADRTQRQIVADFANPNRFHFFSTQPLFDGPPFHGLYADGRKAPDAWLVKAKSTFSKDTWYHPNKTGWDQEGSMLAKDPWVHAAYARIAESVPQDGVVRGQAPTWGDYFEPSIHTQPSDYGEQSDLGAEFDFYDNARGEAFTLWLVAVVDRSGGEATIDPYGLAFIVGDGTPEATGLRRASTGNPTTWIPDPEWCVTLVSTFVEGPLRNGGSRSEFAPSVCFDSQGASVPEPPGLDWASYYEATWAGQA